MWVVRKPGGTLYFHPTKPKGREKRWWKWVTREGAWRYATEFAAQKTACDLRLAGELAAAEKL